MAKLTRVDQRVFGDVGATGQFGQIGSDSAGVPQKTKDPATIQSLDEFVEGLYSITANAGEPPRIEDLNSLYFLITRQIAYLLQQGTPEWSATQRYYVGSTVQKSGKVYVALLGDDVTNNNTNQDPDSQPTWWKDLGDATKLNGQAASFYQNAGNINAGLLPLDRLPTNLTGKSADLLDGLNTVGTGTVGIPVTVDDVPDCNNVDGNGVFFQTTVDAANTPVSGAYFSGVHFLVDNNPNYAAQIGISNFGTAWYVRAKNNGVWGAWSKIWNELSATDQRITTGGTRTETVNSISVGETKHILWTIRNTSGGNATLTLALPATGNYQVYLNWSGASGTNQLYIVNNLNPNLVFGSVYSNHDGTANGGSTVAFPVIATDGAIYVQGTIKRIS